MHAVCDFYKSKRKLEIFGACCREVPDSILEVVSTVYNRAQFRTQTNKTKKPKIPNKTKLGKKGYCPDCEDRQ
jgi:hypothetical protein